ncbi:MAG: DMT family transporter [Actinomycetota bacterium]|nr:DMT family transporter [Actinomycetota bacterium]
MDRRSWTLVMALGAIWGASFLFIEIGLRDLGPAVVAWARVALAALVLVPVAAYRGELRIPGASVGLIALLGTVQVGVPFAILARGQEEITSSLAGILVASTPLFTALLAVRVDPTQKSEGIRLWGVIAGLVGVGLLLGIDLSGTTAEALGGTLVLLASLGYATGGLITKLKLPGAPGTGVAAWITVAATLVLTPFAIADAPADVPGLGPVVAVAALGVIGTGLAFAIFFGLMTTIGPARTFIVTYLSPGFAVVYGALLLDEPVSVATLAGLALILGGSYLAGGYASSRSGPATP